LNSLFAIFSVLRISIVLLLGSLFVLFSCNLEKDKFKPEDYFTESQKKAIEIQLVLKTAKKPEGSLTGPEIEAYYREQAITIRWHYAHEKNGIYYFLISRPAPSLYEKRAAIGGSFTSPDNLHIKAFKEVFQTFKMKPEILLTKGAVLFEKMVNGQDLKSYYPNKNNNKEEWIEFPDDINYYDSVTQSWKMKLVTNPELN